MLTMLLLKLVKQVVPLSSLDFLLVANLHLLQAAIVTHQVRQDLLELNFH